MTESDFTLRGDHIPLDRLLKATGLAPSGGVAKLFISQGEVSVDGQPELRKTCKLRAGAVVSFGDQRIRIVAPST